MKTGFHFLRDVAAPRSLMLGACVWISAFTRIVVMWYLLARQVLLVMRRLPNEQRRWKWDGTSSALLLVHHAPRYATAGGVA